mmetsp:Transcript_54135/g.131377  ORF Transcript_54135/g.131377 Transcript_54135/m.131377 type:complete len:385 (+) Transcript_54135:1085-2239(+)
MTSTRPPTSSSLVGDDDTDGSKDGVLDGLADGEADGLLDGLADGVADGLLEGEALGVPVGADDGDSVGLEVGSGLIVGSGVNVGDADGSLDSDGTSDGSNDSLGSCEKVGTSLGSADRVGNSDGSSDSVGNSDGSSETDGAPDGIGVGTSLGVSLGILDGVSDGKVDGVEVGVADGVAVGGSVLGKNNITSSITWMTPLHASISNSTISGKLGSMLAVPTWKNLVVNNFLSKGRSGSRLSSHCVSVGKPLAISNSESQTKSSLKISWSKTTWYNRISEISAFVRLVKTSSPILSKASLVGANTVKTFPSWSLKTKSRSVNNRRSHRISNPGVVHAISVMVTHGVGAAVGLEVGAVVTGVGFLVGYGVGGTNLGYGVGAGGGVGG